HFVTVWNLHGRRAQVMDPAAGRRWPTLAGLERDAWRHRMPVPAAAWRSWAGGEEALCALDGRFAALGVAGADRRAWIEEASGDGSWRSLAGLDAAARWTRELLLAGAVRRGNQAGKLLHALWVRGRAGVAPHAERAATCGGAVV